MKNETTLSACFVAPLIAFLLLFGPSLEDGHAQVAFGAQGGWGSEADLGIGARVLANLGGSNFEAVGTVDRFFPDNDLDWWDFNANLFYHFHRAEGPSVLPYLGGGLNVARLSTDGSSSSEAGVNLAGGVRFPGDVTPFLELRAAFSEADQIVLTGGILFGPTLFP